MLNPIILKKAETKFNELVKNITKEDILSIKTNLKKNAKEFAKTFVNARVDWETFDTIRDFYFNYFSKKQ